MSESKNKEVVVERDVSKRMKTSLNSLLLDNLIIKMNSHGSILLSRIQK